uniref:ATP synthase F0 subunit 8 n=1 Tax=Amara aulica TaxID=536885 RepID=A0A6G7GDD6_AMAAU|nr:ATP synthase F0 subunit 8 [Amara aulica]
MPQMMPMNWFMLYIMFTLIFFLMNFLNYYLFLIKNNTNFFKKKINSKMLIWKW